MYQWINKEVLLYRTGNSIQDPGINHNGKEYKKGIHTYIHIYISESFFCIAVINTTL